MRSKQLILVAAGLLLVCTVLIIRQSAGNGREAGSIRTSPKANHLATRELRTPRRLPGGSRPETIPSAEPIPQDQAAATKSRTDHPQKASSVTTALGFRLADYVQLPAVILALDAAAKDPQRKVPAPVAAAMRGIVDQFYQDLAEGYRTSPEGTDHGNSDPTNTTDNTIVIEPGPVVERARAHANATYRALFGDAAFNQMTMNALKESHLPPEASSGGNH